MIKAAAVDIGTFVSRIFLLPAVVFFAFFSPYLEGNAGAFWTEIHQLVASEATRVSTVPQELFLYAGSPRGSSSYRSTLSEGAYDEDADRDPRLGGGVFAWWGLLNWGTHFWDPAGGPAGGLLTDVVGFPVNVESKNAYQRAIDLYRAAENLYGQDPGAAYYLLGRVSHLLADMATPAHVHLDPHISDASATGDDSFEEYTGIRYGYPGPLSFEAAFPVLAVSPPDPELLPDGGYRDEPVLFNIFYSMASFSATFDSDDADGIVDHGARRGHSIPVSRGDLKNVYAIRTGYPDLLLTDGYDFSAARHKVVLLDSLLRSLTAPGVPFDGIKLEFEGTSESHALSEFLDTDIGDHDLETMAAELIPDAIGHVASLYRRFWTDTHPSLSGVLPQVIFDKGERGRIVTRPNALEFDIAIAAHDWNGINVDIYAWAELLYPDHQYRLYYTGDWVTFENISELRPVISNLLLADVQGVNWQVLGSTEPLPAGMVVLHLCIQRSSGNVFRPAEAVCGGNTVSVE